MSKGWAGCPIALGSWSSIYLSLGCKYWQRLQTHNRNCSFTTGWSSLNLPLSLNDQVDQWLCGLVKPLQSRSLTTPRDWQAKAMANESHSESSRQSPAMLIIHHNTRTKTMTDLVWFDMIWSRLSLLIRQPLVVNITKPCCITSNDAVVSFLLRPL